MQSLLPYSEWKATIIHYNDSVGIFFIWTFRLIVCHYEMVSVVLFLSQDNGLFNDRYKFPGCPRDIIGVKSNSWYFRLFKKPYIILICPFFTSFKILYFYFTRIHKISLFQVCVLPWTRKTQNRKYNFTRTLLWKYSRFFVIVTTKK